jgi:hypothetical protein
MTPSSIIECRESARWFYSLVDRCDSIPRFLPLPARNEWGEDRGEGHYSMRRVLLSPSLSFLGWEEREKTLALLRL